MSNGAAHGVFHRDLERWWTLGSRALHATLLRFVTSTLALLFGIVGARFIGPEAFGTYAFLMAIVGFLSVITSVGMPTLITREIASAHGNGAYGGLAPLTHICFLLVATNIALYCASLIFRSTDLSLVIAAVLAFNLAALLFGANCGHERVLFATWMNLALRPLVALGALYLLVQLGKPSYETAVFAQLIGAVCGAAALILPWKPHEIWTDISGTLSNRWWSPQHLTIVRTGMVFAGGQLLINATTQIDILILSTLASPQDVAHYYAAARGALVVSFFLGSSAALAEPKLARLYSAGQLDEFKSVLRGTALIGAAMTMASALVALIAAPYYFDLYGPTFAAGMPSFVILVVGLIGLSLFGPAQVGLRAVRREKSVLYATAIALGVNGVTSVALIPLIGVTGAAIGTTVQFLVYGATMAYMISQTNGLRSDLFRWERLSPLTARTSVTQPGSKSERV